MKHFAKSRSSLNLSKIWIAPSALKIADFRNQEFAKYSTKSRSFLQSHSLIVIVFKIWSLQNILQNPELFAKLKSKPLQNLDFARYFTFCILHFGHFTKSSWTYMYFRPIEISSLGFVDQMCETIFFSVLFKDHYIFIISQLWLTSHPRRTVVLLDTGTPGASREITKGLRVRVSPLAV